jgi:uncharacterized membrane protein
VLPIYAAQDFAVAIPAMSKPVSSLVASAYVVATITVESFVLAAIPGFVYTVADIAELPSIMAVVVATALVCFEFGACMFVVAKLAVTMLLKVIYAAYAFVALAVVGPKIAFL